MPEFVKVFLVLYGQRLGAVTPYPDKEPPDNMLRLMTTPNVNCQRKIVDHFAVFRVAFLYDCYEFIFKSEWHFFTRENEKWIKTKVKYSELELSKNLKIALRIYENVRKLKQLL